MSGGLTPCRHLHGENMLLLQTVKCDGKMDGGNTYDLHRRMGTLWLGGAEGLIAVLRF